MQTASRRIPSHLKQGSPSRDRHSHRFALTRRKDARERVALLRALATMLAARTPVADALRSAGTLFPGGAMERRVRQAERSIRSGKPLAEALASTELLPARGWQQLVRIGEESGLLPEAVAQLAEEAERAEALRKRVRSAMAYPVFVCAVACAAVVFLLTVIVPTFADMYAGFGAELPTSTQRLMTISSALTRAWPVFLAGGVAVSFGATRLTRVARVRAALDRLYLRLPVVGTVVRNRDAASFSRAMATMLRSGIDAEASLTLAAKTISNTSTKAEVATAAGRVRSGHSVGEALGAARNLPPLMVAMIAAGDASGDLPTVFGKSATYYEAEVTNALDTLVGLLEPAVILVLGAILCWVLAALYLPMFEMASVIR